MTSQPDPVIWEARHDGLRLYSGGQHVGTVPYDSLPALLVSIAGALKNRPET